jgi:hypothetical protein
MSRPTLMTMEQRRGKVDCYGEPLRAHVCIPGRFPFESEVTGRVAVVPLMDNPIPR